MGRLFLRPHEGMIYRPWSKGDEHTGKSCLVKIHTDGQTYDGTFRVADGMYTIVTIQGGTLNRSYKRDSLVGGI